MKKLLLLSIVIIGLAGCRDKKSTTTPIVIHDTITVEKHDGGKMVEGTVKQLLIQYYKAGWMDGSNGLIDLSNAGRLDLPNIEKIKYTDWRKIEFDVNSK